jgi:hypothetical protein
MDDRARVGCHLTSREPVFFLQISGGFDRRRMLFNSAHYIERDAYCMFSW